jgi:hypothetical protein
LVLQQQQAGWSVPPVAVVEVASGLQEFDNSPECVPFLLFQPRFGHPN